MERFWNGETPEWQVKIERWEGGLLIGLPSALCPLDERVRVVFGEEASRVLL